MIKRAVGLLIDLARNSGTDLAGQVGADGDDRRDRDAVDH